MHFANCPGNCINVEHLIIVWLAKLDACKRKTPFVKLAPKCIHKGLCLIVNQTFSLNSFPLPTGSFATMGWSTCASSRVSLTKWIGTLMTWHTKQRFLHLWWIVLLLLCWTQQLSSHHNLKLVDLNLNEGILTPYHQNSSFIYLCFNEFAILKFLWSKLSFPFFCQCNSHFQNVLQTANRIYVC